MAGDDDAYEIRLDGVNMKVGYSKGGIIKPTPLPELFIPMDGERKASFIDTSNVTAPDLHFSDGKGGSVVIKFATQGEATVELSENMTWDKAGKIFWNAVHRVMSKPEPFPDME